MGKSKKVFRKTRRNSLPTPPVALPPLLVTIKDAAGLLGATVWAVRELLWSKKVPFVRIGRRFLIDPADLHQFIARQKKGGE